MAIYTDESKESIKSAVAMLPDTEMELPYEGGKEMLLVEDVDNRELLQDLLQAMYKELPDPKKKKLRKDV